MEFSTVQDKDMPTATLDALKASGDAARTAVVLVGLSLLLMIAFRSIAVPIKATVGFRLSVGSAFGATCPNRLISRLTAEPSTDHQVQRGLDLKWAAQDRWSHFHHLKRDLPWLRSSTGWPPSAHDDNDQRRPAG